MKNQEKTFTVNGITFTETEYQDYLRMQKDFENETKKSFSGVKVSVFKSEQDRHKWQKKIKKILPNFGKISLFGNIEKFKIAGAKNLHNDFQMLVTLWNETHVNDFSFNAENLIKESDLRDINNTNAIALKEACETKNIEGLNYCLKVFENEIK